MVQVTFDKESKVFKWWDDLHRRKYFLGEKTRCFTGCGWRGAGTGVYNNHLHFKYCWYYPVHNCVVRLMFVYVSISPTFIVFIKTFIYYCIVIFSKIHVYFVLLRKLFRLFSTKKTPLVFARLNQLNGCVIKNVYFRLRRYKLTYLLRFTWLLVNHRTPIIVSFKLFWVYLFPFPMLYIIFILWFPFKTNIYPPLRYLQRLGVCKHVLTHHMF